MRCVWRGDLGFPRRNEKQLAGDDGLPAFGLERHVAQGQRVTF